MPYINQIPISTIYGEKEIEIYNADITKLDFEVDITVISAYKNSYSPTPNSIVKSLLVNHEISVADLSKNKLLDYSIPLNAWVSNQINSKLTKHILCIEGISKDIQLNGHCEKSIVNLFTLISILHNNNIPHRKIAIPIIGTGNQKNSLELVIPLLVSKAIYCLENVQQLETIYFVEIDSSKASNIDDCVNRYLKRDNISTDVLCSDEKNNVYLNETQIHLEKIVEGNSDLKNSIEINTFLDRLKSKETTFFELQNRSRKILEALLRVLLNDNKSNLANLTHKLNNKNIVSSWIISYLHTVRFFGNYEAHDVDKNNHIPKLMERQDQYILLVTFNGFLKFYNNHAGDIKQKLDQGNSHADDKKQKLDQVKLKA